METAINLFVSGTHNVEPDEVIPKDAASSSLNWLTRNGKIELIYGRRSIGGDGAAGKNYGEHTGFMANGTAVRFRKVEGKIQYLNSSSVWTDVITGLSLTDYTFANYVSLAGAFVFCFGVDGIYKIATANPGNYTAMYDSTKNFKGYGLIDKGRTILWGRAQDPTGLYGSRIDAQDATVYTTISGEVTASLTGTLAFKGAGATRTCLAVVITVGAEVFTDNVNGVLVGNLGGTGTINYTTGEYTVSVAGAGSATYQWENSNIKGVTDFSHSATRLASEGFVVRQDVGGDAIKVVIPYGGSYFSLKARSCYQFTPDATDLNPKNEIFRTDIGVPGLRSAIGTSFGIMLLNVANPTFPMLQIIKRNTLGDNFDTGPLFPHFSWANYTYTDVTIDTWDTYVLIACAEKSTENNRLILADATKKSVDVMYYGARTFTKNGGYLYAGDPVSQTTYELFTGFDDNGIAVQNQWTSRGESYLENLTRALRLRFAGRLCKVKHLRLRGFISPNQAVQVYITADDGDAQLVGTIVGSGDYVDYTSSFALGTSFIGAGTIGGDDGVNVYKFTADIKVKVGKFRKRQVKFVATGIGYVAITSLVDVKIGFFDSHMPKKYRNKQNVSLDGLSTNQANPSY